MLKRRVDVYMDAYTRGILMKRFDYCFVQPAGSSYPAILKAHDIRPPEPMTDRGSGRDDRGRADRAGAWRHHLAGFRFGDVAYSPTSAACRRRRWHCSQGLDLWIVDALRPIPHPSHFSLKQALQWIERVGAKRGILTHMTTELDYAALKRELPQHIEPAYDGMVVHVE